MTATDEEAGTADRARSAASGPREHARNNDETRRGWSWVVPLDSGTGREQCGWSSTNQGREEQEPSAGGLRCSGHNPVRDFLDHPRPLLHCSSVLIVSVHPRGFSSSSPCDWRPPTRTGPRCVGGVPVACLVGASGRRVVLESNYSSLVSVCWLLVVGWCVAAVFLGFSMRGSRAVAYWRWFRFPAVACRAGSRGRPRAWVSAAWRCSSSPA